jgi:toluene monooxygenase system protein E
VVARERLGAVVMPPPRPPGHKTYTRLATGRRLPPEYEVVSSDLHYNYPDRFELDDNSVARWYQRHREGSTLHCDDWEAFNDPRRTTYRGYNEVQDQKEAVVDGLLREIDETEYDSGLAEDWVAFLDRWYAPLRYPAHGLQMLAAYIAQLAPASRITNCAAFQAADEIRRLQRTAYRTAQLASHRSGIDTAAHLHQWETAAELQPLRELVERALVTYDWGESLVATNVVVKPHLDRFINQVLAGALAAANGDPILQSIHFSLDEDARWHRQWTEAVLGVAIADTESNASVVSGWIDRWRPLATASIEAYADVVAQAPVPLNPAEVTKRITTAVSDELASAPEPPRGNETTG